MKINSCVDLFTLISPGKRFFISLKQASDCAFPSCRKPAVQRALIYDTLLKIHPYLSLRYSVSVIPSFSFLNLSHFLLLLSFFQPFLSVRCWLLFLLLFFFFFVFFVFFFFFFFFFFFVFFFYFSFFFFFFLFFFFFFFFFFFCTTILGPLSLFLALSQRKIAKVRLLVWPYFSVCL